MIIIEKNDLGKNTIIQQIKNSDANKVFIFERLDIADFNISGKQIFCISNSQNVNTNNANAIKHTPKRHNYFSEHIMKKGFMLCSEQEKKCLELALIACKDKLCDVNEKILCLCNYTLTSVNANTSLLNLKNFITICSPYK